MSRSRKSFFELFKRRLSTRLESRKRHAVAFWKSIHKSINALFKQQEGEVFRSASDRRRMPAGLNYINPIFWLIQFAKFVVRYVQSRNYVTTLRGLPAAAGFITPIVLTLWVAPSFDEELRAARNRLARVETTDELEAADFYARKVCSMIPDEAAAWMQLAVIRDRQGRSAEAEQLAIEKGVERGYVPAAEWLTDRRFAAVVNQPNPDPALEKELVDGLKWIIARREEDIRSNFMLGTYLMSRGQLLEARPVFRRITSLPKGNFPEALYSLAVVEAQLGEIQESRATAGLAADAFLKRDALQDFRVEPFMQLVRSLLLAQREQEAIQLINQKNTDNPQFAEQFRSLTGEVFASWSKRLRTTAGRTPEEIQAALRAISEAVVAAPSSPMVIDELVALAGCSEISDETLDQHLQDALNAGVSPGVIHFIQGTRCIARNPPDIEAGLQHLRLADTHNPGMPGLLNNMADAIVDSKTPDLDQALRLVNQALELIPRHPHVHDTRGKIYLRMGDPLKAIADFEQALKSDELRPVAHARIAEAYRMLGNEQQSAYHEAMVDSHKKVLQKRAAQP